MTHSNSDKNTSSTRKDAKEMMVSWELASGLTKMLISISYAKLRKFT